jgi:hypothetical protein
MHAAPLLTHSRVLDRRTLLLDAYKGPSVRGRVEAGLYVDVLPPVLEVLPSV